MNFAQLTGVVKRLESLVALNGRKASSGSAAFLAARNDIFAENSGGPIGPGATVSWLSGAFTPTATGAGKVKLRAMMTVTIAGATSVAGEQIQFQLVKNGVPFGPLVNTEIGATRGFASATIVWEDTGLVPGVPILNYGIQAVNITTPAHTLVVPTNNAVIEVEERP